MKGFTLERPTIAQHLNAGNDRNGNGRHVYVGYSTSGAIVSIHDIEPAWWNDPEVVRLPMVQITLAEYREWKHRDAARTGPWGVIEIDGDTVTLWERTSTRREAETLAQSLHTGWPDRTFTVRDMRRRPPTDTLVVLATQDE